MFRKVQKDVGENVMLKIYNYYINIYILIKKYKKNAISAVKTLYICALFARLVRAASALQQLFACCAAAICRTRRSFSQC